MPKNTVRRKNPPTYSGLPILLVTILLIMFSGPFVEADDSGLDVFSSQVISGTETVFFRGDRFTYNLKTGVVTGSGNIEVIQAENSLRGQEATIDLPNKVARIEGNVVATRAGGVVEGERAVYNFEEQRGVFESARGRSDPWYVTADRVERESAESYAVANASLTTCNLPDPHYQLRSGSVTVVPNERLVSRKLTLLAGTVPVFYLPYYSQGLGPKRPPLEFSSGTDSDLGAYARIDYNLELDEEITITPYVAGFTKSGVGVGLESEFSIFDDHGRGDFDSFYIYDLNDDNTDKPGVDDGRGKVDLYYRHELPYDITALMQAEYVSDREFLKQYVFDEFSDRELPETFVNLDRTGLHDVISFTVRERSVDYISDVEREPELRLELLEQRIRDTGFFVSATNDFANLDAVPDGPDSVRNFSQARISYPVRLWEQIGLVPFVEGDATYYSDALDEDDEYRVSWDTGIVGQTRFHKVYGSPFSQYKAFRHLIVPTITYRFRPTPDEEPEDLPTFDSIDLIDRENMVEIELKNYLQGKRSDGSIAELVEYVFSAGLEFEDSEDKFATLENELRIRPVPNWELAMKSFNDFRDARRTDLTSAVLRYTKPESFKASVGAIHEDTALKRHETQVVYALSKALGPLWRVGFEQRYDFAGDEFSLQEFWVWRDLHCWEVLLRVRDRRESTSVMVLFNIKAFPERKIERKTALEPIRENYPWPTRW